MISFFFVNWHQFRQCQVDDQNTKSKNKIENKVDQINFLIYLKTYLVEAKFAALVFLILTKLQIRLLFY